MKTGSGLNMTAGSPTRLLILFAIPMLIGNLFQQAYSLADSVIVGQVLGSAALAAIGSTGSVTFLFFSICNGVASGCGIVTSQYFGAGNASMTRRAIANAAYIMFTASLVMGVFGAALATYAGQNYCAGNMKRGRDLADQRRVLPAALRGMEKEDGGCRT